MIDLDAIQNEADDKPFEFTFGGDTYTLPPRIDMRAVGAMSEGRVGDALRMMLGAEQWKRIQQAEAVLDDRKLGALMEAYAEHNGVTVGESSASVSSSASTRGRSKPTSSGTTTYR